MQDVVFRMSTQGTPDIWSNLCIYNAINPVAAAGAASVPDSQFMNVESDDRVMQKLGKN